MNNATHCYDPLDAACDILYFSSIITIVLGTIVLASTFALAFSGYDQDAGQVILCGAVATFTCLVVTAVIALALRTEGRQAVLEEQNTFPSEKMQSRGISDAQRWVSSYKKGK